MRKGIVGFSIILIMLISGVNIGAVEDLEYFFVGEQPIMPTFTIEDCECPGVNMNLTLPSYQSRMFGADFHNQGTDPWLRHEVWWYVNAELAQQKFSENLDPTRGVFNIGYAQESVKQYISEGKDYEIIEEDFNETRASFIWREENGRFQGKRVYILKDVYKGSMNAEDFESENEILHAMNTLEDCIKAVINEKENEKDEEIKINGTITGFDLPIKHIKLSFEYKGDKLETSTDSEGYYEISFSDFEVGNEYEMEIEFSYLINDTTYFRFFFNNGPMGYRSTIKLNKDEDLSRDIKLDDIFTEKDGGIAFVSMYIHFTEVLEFYKDILGEKVDFQLPVYIDIFNRDIPENVNAYYDGRYGESTIKIDVGTSKHDSKFRPLDREYHEFSHYIMHALYKKWPQPDENITTIEEINNDGYINPSTADSFIEGFAYFMSRIIGLYYKDNTVPQNFDDDSEKRLMDILAEANSPDYFVLEKNFKAWDRLGKAEKFAIAGILWDLYDSDHTYRKRTPEEAYLLFYPKYLQWKSMIKQSAKAWAEYYNEEYKEPDIPEITLDYFKNLKFEDDNVNLSFEDIWNIISVYHSDFTSVYQMLITQFSSIKTELDEIFIEHGFFKDKNKGNGTRDSWEPYRDENNNNTFDTGEYFIDFPKDIHYDKGESIGTASNYNRTWRRTAPELPGQYIKVDNEIPFYLVGTYFPFYPYLNSLVKSENVNGYVYVDVPPSSYESYLYVIPEGVELVSPILIFNTTDFNDAYEETINNGYYLEHEFEFTGEIPSPPVIPDLSVDDHESSDKVKASPGFEIILVFCIILFIIIWKRKKRF